MVMQLAGLAWCDNAPHYGLTPVPYHHTMHHACRANVANLLACKTLYHCVPGRARLYPVGHI